MSRFILTQRVLYRHLGQSEHAITALQRSIALYDSANDLPGLEKASSNLGCVYQDLGEWDEALYYFQRSAELSNKTKDERRRAAAANNLAEIYRRQGKLDQALALYEQALGIAREFEFWDYVAVALMNLGASHLKGGKLDTAHGYLSKSEAVAREKAKVHLPEILHYQAELYLLYEKLEESRQKATEALNQAVEADQAMAEGLARYSLGRASEALGAIEQAIEQLIESLTIFEGHQCLYETGLANLSLASLYEAQFTDETTGVEGIAQGIQYCARAITIFRKLNSQLDLEAAYQVQSSLEKKGSRR